jgi:hypothetical protein
MSNAKVQMSNQIQSSNIKIEVKAEVEVKVTKIRF